jgi:hypothetical protein
MNYGTTLLASTGTLALVTTANTAIAQVRISNPGPAAASVKLKVKVGKFKVAPQSKTVAPYHSAVISITPNTAIPAAGEASLVMSSTQAVDVTLATGTADGLTFSPLGSPGSRVVLADVTGAGYGEATVTNATIVTTDVKWALIHHGVVASTGSTTLGAGGTISLGQLLGGRDKLKGATLLLSSATRALVVDAILNTTPGGVTLAAALNGG